MEELPNLPRLILIDAANFMNVFKKVSPNYSPPSYESRQNAFHIIPVVQFFVARGYTVQVIAGEHALKPHITQFSYLLKELKSMKLLSHPKFTGKEADDRTMLKYAEEYGAIILSNDKFKYHLEFKEIPNRYVVGFERKKYPVDPDVTNNFGTDCNYVFRLEGKRFFAAPGDDDYEKVQKSHQDFEHISQENFRRLQLMTLYLHCDICSKVGAPFPDSASFLDPQKPFPVNFQQFETAADRCYAV